MRTKNEEYFKMIEAFIDEYKEKTGTAPTVQEISNGIGVPKTTVCRYLAYMREHGMLDYTGHRNIQTKASQMTRGETIMTPILGKVSCGVPKFAEENIEEYVRLPVALFGRGQFFILRANGDSMIEADINDGDLVLIRQQNYADEGQTVVALMDDEATLKRYYPEPEKQRIEQLSTKGVEFISKKESLDTSTPSGRFVLTIFGAVAQLEREYLLQRQKEGIAIAKQEGKYKGRKPLERTGQDAVIASWRNGEMTAVEAMQRLQMSKTTFYRRANQMERRKQP